ncbi:MAG: hypothetical protein B6I31_04405 [Desulfobacteraceae bacterium 4572_19]|nr:MAG: hypothetical protein B6I31_04405 [Desulfobacteraceae bacterium 4572_19]
MKKYIEHKITKKKILFSTVLFSTMFIFYTGIISAGQVVDKIIAIVNGDIITLKDLNVAIRPYLQKISNSSYSFEEKDKILTKFKADALSKLVNEMLTDQEIKKLKLTVEDDEVDNAIEQIKITRNFTDEEFIDALRKDGMDIHEVREMIKRQILRPRLLNYRVKSKVIITKKDIQKYYEAHPEIYSTEKKYSLKTILLPHTLNDGKDPMEIMNNIILKFHGGESFEKLAKEYSIVPNVAETGGDLGTFTLGSLSPQLQKALIGVEAGECTLVLDTDHGYQIFYVSDIEADSKKVSEEISKKIKATLYEKLVNEKFNVWINELRKQAHIKIME